MTVEEFGQKVKTKYPQYQSLSDSEVGQKMLQKYPQYQSQVSSSAPPAQPPASPDVQGAQQRSDFVESLGNGILNLGKDITRPLRIAGEGAIDIGKMASHPISYAKGITGQNLNPQDVKNITSQQDPVLITPQEQKDVTSESLPLAAARETAGLESFVVPFGKGAGLASRAILPGMAVGGMSAFSQPHASTGKVVGGAALGGVTAGLTYGLLDHFAKSGATIDPSKLTSDQKAFLGQFQAPKAATKYMNLNNTAQKMTQWGFGDATPEELQAAAEGLTGDTGKLTQITRDIAAQTGDIPIPDTSRAAESVFNTTVNQKGSMVGGNIIQKGSQAENALNQIRGAWSGLNTVNAADALDQARLWEKWGNFYAASPNPDDKLIAKAFRAAADEVTNKIDKQAVDQGIIDAVKTPENYAAIAQYSKPMADQFMSDSTRNLSDIRSLAAPHVVTSRLLAETNKQETSAFTRGLDKISQDQKDLAMLNPTNWPGMAAKAVGGPALTAGKKAVGTVASQLPTIAQGVERSPAAMQAVGQLSTQVPQKVLSSSTNSAQTPAAPQTTQLPPIRQQMQQPMSSSQQTGLTNIPQTTGTYTAQNYMTDIRRINSLTVRSNEKSRLVALAKDMFNASQANIKQSGGTMTTQEKQFYNQIPQMLSTISQLRGQINDIQGSVPVVGTKYGIPVIGDYLETSDARTDPKFSAMVANMTTLSSLIAKQAVGGRLTGELIKLFQKAVPTPKDSKEAALEKLNQFEQHLQDQYQQMNDSLSPGQLPSIPQQIQ